MKLKSNKSTGEACLEIEGSDNYLLGLEGGITGLMIRKEDVCDYEGNVNIDSFKINNSGYEYPRIVSHKNGILFCAGYSEKHSTTKTLCYFLGINPKAEDGPFKDSIEPGKVLLAPEAMLNDFNAPIVANSENNDLTCGRFLASIRTNDIIEQAGIDSELLAPVAACIFACEEHGSDLHRTASNIGYRHNIDSRLIENLTNHAINKYSPEHQHLQNDEPEMSQALLF